MADGIEAGSSAWHRRAELEEMWREQWDRVQRRVERVRVATQQHTPGMSTDDRKDDLYAFFQDCFHLKDWLKHDPNSANQVTGVEAIIKGSTELSLLRDLAIGAKHLTIGGPGHPAPYSGDASSAVTRQDIDLVVGQGARQTFYVGSNGVEWDAWDLATQCVAQWEAYLIGKGLLP